MWLLTTFGFFSIVEKPEDRGTGMVTVRARVRGDIEVAAHPLPARAERDRGHPGARLRLARPRQPRDLGKGLARVALDIDYANFETEVAQHMGYARELVYHDVYETLSALSRYKPEPDR